HLHCIWHLPPGDDDYPTRWSILKRRFSQRWRDFGGATDRRSASRARTRELGVWQRRYWEHLIRDERALLAYRDYIHMNPVKHGYVRHPHGWPWSSVHRHLRTGWLAADWTSASGVEITVPGDL
ncbi:MAG: transposase, partial [Phycisphaerae bacterium]|nr:transposase [Phycisphaerae bacterium]